MKMTPEMIEQAQEMREQGVSYGKIARTMGIGVSTARYHVNSAYREAHEIYAVRHREEHPEKARAYCAAHKEESKAYRASRREATAVYNADYHASHKDEAVAYRLANKEKRAAYNRIYEDSHKEEGKAYRAARKEQKAAYDAIYKPAYTAKHLPESAARCSIRRALIAGTMIGITIAQKAQIDEIYRKAKEDPKVRCYICDKLIPLGDREVDHIFPVAKGGPTRPSNLAIACSHCNRSKNAKHPNELGILI